MRAHSLLRQTLEADCTEFRNRIGISDVQLKAIHMMRRGCSTNTIIDNVRMQANSLLLHNLEASWIGNGTDIEDVQLCRCGTATTADNVRRWGNSLWQHDL